MVKAFIWDKANVFYFFQRSTKYRLSFSFQATTLRHKKIKIKIIMSQSQSGWLRGLPQYIVVHTDRHMPTITGIATNVKQR